MGKKAAKLKVYVTASRVVRISTVDDLLELATFLLGRESEDFNFTNWKPGTACYECRLYLSDGEILWCQYFSPRPPAMHELIAHYNAAPEKWGIPLSM
jgi:hypothetical protein